MNKKAKRITVALVAVLCFLLVFALGFGLTGAWYQAERTATGTVTLDQGIILNYKGFSEATTTLTPWTKEANLKLFADVSGVPNATITVPESAIAKSTENGVIDYVVRAKLAYTYYIYGDSSRTTVIGKDGAAYGAQGATGYTATELGLAGDTAVMANPLAFDTTVWTVNGDYAYYTGVANGTTLAYLPTTEVNLFAGNIVLADWTAEFGGPEGTIGEDKVEIAKIVVTLTVEAVQPGAQTSWGIKTLPPQA